MTAQSSIPLKWYVPFANGDSGRVEIPVTTADPTRASQTLGFPPLTMQPPESGGVPPQGEDFNGGMNQVARIAWWVLNGGGWPYDSTFATNSNINGYPNGATLQAADFRGNWINTADNNQNNPDTNGSSWVPGFQYGVTALSGLTGGTVTPTPAQAAKGSITFAGTLGSALTVILPTWTKNWTLTNNTTGAFVVIVKTAAGAGVTIPQNSSPTRVSGDGTNIVQSPENIAAATQSQQPPQLGQIQTQAGTAFTTAGTAPAFTLTPTPAITLASPVRLRASFNAAGTTGSNTINVNGTGVKNLVQFDTAGNLQPANITSNLLSDIEYNGTSWVVLDPLPGSSLAGVQGSFKNLALSTTGLSAVVTVSADELVVESTGSAYQILRPVSVSPSLAASGVNGLDTGTSAINTWYSVWVIWNGTTTAGLLSLSSTAPTLPAGYTYKARVGWGRSDGTANKFFTSFKQFGRSAQYVVVPASNTVTFPTVASGTAGNPATPTYVAVSISSLTPPTAARVKGTITNFGNNYVAVAPNGSFGVPGSATNPPPTTVYTVPGNGAFTSQFDYILESTNLYWTSNSSSGLLQCMGWEDNL